jgi:hypothetical protein
MAMSMKEEFLFLWLLVAVIFSFVFRHFWESAIYVLSRAVALNLVSLPSLGKFAVVVFGVHLLP